MTYETSRNIAFLFLLLYALIGFWGHVTREDTEDLYPFFSWSLFAQVPERTQNGFDVYVQSVEGEALAQPTPARDIPGLVRTDVNYQTYAHLANEFGRALVSSEDARAREARDAFESLLVASATYEIRATRFDPLQKFLSGAVSTSTVLGLFDFRKRTP